MRRTNKNTIAVKNSKLGLDWLGKTVVHKSMGEGIVVGYHPDTGEPLTYFYSDIYGPTPWYVSHREVFLLNEKRIWYLCDGEKKDCKKTSCYNNGEKGQCCHTSDVNHAVNFKKSVHGEHISYREINGTTTLQ